MGYNLVTRCETCNQQAFIFRGKEAESISMWLRRHGTGHRVIWGVDNNDSTPDWVDEESDLCLPDDVLPTGEPIRWLT